MRLVDSPVVNGVSSLKFYTSRWVLTYFSSVPAVHFDILQSKRSLSLILVGGVLVLMFFPETKLNFRYKLIKANIVDNNSIWLLVSLSNAGTFYASTSFLSARQHGQKEIFLINYTTTLLCWYALSWSWASVCSRHCKCPWSCFAKRYIETNDCISVRQTAEHQFLQVLENSCHWDQPSGRQLNLYLSIVVIKTVRI